MLISEATLIYDHKILFERLDLPWFKHQWTCILGPSGTGKTSLLRMIAGLWGVDNLSHSFYAKRAVLTKDVSYMSQQDSLLPWLNALDNVLIGLKLRGEKISLQKKNDAQALLAKMALDADTIKKKPSQLSGGQRQRIALARTLFEDKDILLLDEPFSSLDAITKFRLQKLFKQSLAYKTVVLVTHDPKEALSLGDHIYILAGSPAELTPVLFKNEDHLLEQLAGVSEN